MTTKVAVINYGPDPIKIEVQGRDGGKFTAASEVVVAPGTVSEPLYVHSTQTLQLIEAKPAPARHED